MKKCSKCMTVKPLMDFNRKRTIKSGRRAECKFCQRKNGVDYYRENKEILKPKHAARYQANKAFYYQQTKAWAARNPEKRKQSYLKYRHSHLELCRARDERYRLNNMDKDAAKTAKRRADKRHRGAALAYKRAF